MNKVLQEAKQKRLEAIELEKQQKDLAFLQAKQAYANLEESAKLKAKSYYHNIDDLIEKNVRQGCLQVITDFPMVRQYNFEKDKRSYVTHIKINNDYLRSDNYAYWVFKYLKDNDYEPYIDEDHDGVGIKSWYTMAIKWV